MGDSEDSFFRQLVVNLKRWWHDRVTSVPSPLREYARMYTVIGLVLPPLFLTGLYVDEGWPVAVLAPAIIFPMRWIVTNASRLPPTPLNKNVSRGRPLNRAGLVALHWWFSKISYAHIVIATAAVWVAQIIIQAQAVPLAKLGVLFFLSIATVIIWRLDWYLYLSSLPHKARVAGAESKKKTFLCFALLIGAYVFFHGQGIPLISMLSTEDTINIAMYLAAAAVLLAIATIFMAIWRIFGFDWPSQPDPTDVIANQNRARDADFAQAAAADEALRGWNDISSPKFDD